MHTATRYVHQVLGLFAILALTLGIGCKGDADPVSADLTADEQLIQAIQQSTDKRSIDPRELPPPAQAVLEVEYSQGSVRGAKWVRDLGYEVEMETKAWGELFPWIGQVYFDLYGRELRTIRDSRAGWHRGGGGWGKCFTFVYPITYIMPDGTEITVESKLDLQSRVAIGLWYREHPGVQVLPALKYPLDVTLSDGTTLTITNNEELRELLAQCGKPDKEGDWSWTRCVELVYPITYIMPDGQEIVVESKFDVKGRIAIGAWFAENPGVWERPMLKFPVDVRLSDGTTVTVNSEQELRDLYADCGDGRGP
jgi:hypothetical protein